MKISSIMKIFGRRRFYVFGRRLKNRIKENRLLKLSEKFIEGKKAGLVIFEFETGRLAVLAAASSAKEWKWFAQEITRAEIISWGKKLKAGKALVLSCGELNELQITPGKDMYNDEITAEAGKEIGKLTGASEEKIRAAWMKPDALGGGHGFMAQAFNTTEIEAWADACRKGKTRFIGMSGLYMHLPLLLESKYDAWIFMQQYGGSAGLLENGRLLFRQLPFGLPGPKLPEDAWLTRCKQRLGQFADRRVLMLSFGDEAAGPSDALERELACKIYKGDIGNACKTIALKALALSSENLSCPALPPPRKKDPREAGTVVCLVMIGFTFVSLGLQYWQLSFQKATLQKSLERGSNHKQIIEEQEKSIDGIKHETSKYRFQHKMLTERNPVGKPFMDIISFLSVQNLRYTCLERLRQEKDGISIEGESMVQEELSSFLEKLTAFLHEKKMHFKAERIERNTLGAIKFRIRIKEKTESGKASEKA